MSDKLDSVTLKSFYYNLTLGLVKYLELNKNVKNVNTVYHTPCDVSSINQWEKDNSCIMAVDMKNFYLSTNGFHLMWSFQLEAEFENIGCIRINELKDLKKLTWTNPDNEDSFENTIEILECYRNKRENRYSFPDKNSKIFVIDETPYVGAICAVIKGQSFDAQIWLIDPSYQWHFLAPTFTKYFRMSIYYQGLPQWQYLVVQNKLSLWAENAIYKFNPAFLIPGRDHIKYKCSWDPNNVKIDRDLFDSLNVTSESHESELGITKRKKQKKLN